MQMYDTEKSYVEALKNLVTVRLCSARPASPRSTASLHVDIVNGEIL